MTPVFETIATLIVVGIGLFFFMAMLSPFESLGWWAGWSKRRLERELVIDQAGIRSEISLDSDRQRGRAGMPSPVYLVYLRGIATADAIPSGREQNFLDVLGVNLPGATIVADVFPYSATNNPLTGERTFARLYRWLSNARERYRNSLFAIVFIIHNLFQVGVSGDSRYGPIFNVGMAREIARSLLRHGYPTLSREPIWLMGWSGAGQIAVGAARYLRHLFQAPVYVVSIGGVILDDPGIADITHLYHLKGSADMFPRLGDILSPGRWSITRRSAWNRAWDERRITIIDPGPMKHTGRGDYFDHNAVLLDGQNHAQKTATVITEIITRLY